MATINPSQDYDIIHTLTYASSGGNVNNVHAGEPVDEPSALQVWTGSDWKLGKVWDGSTWREDAKVWDGSQWAG